MKQEITTSHMKYNVDKITPSKIKRLMIYMKRSVLLIRLSSISSAGIKRDRVEISDVSNIGNIFGTSYLLKNRKSCLQFML